MGLPGIGPTLSGAAAAPVGKPRAAGRPGAQAGDATDDILGALGLSGDELEALRRHGVI